MQGQLSRVSKKLIQFLTQNDFSYKPAHVWGLNLLYIDTSNAIDSKNVATNLVVTFFVPLQQQHSWLLNSNFPQNVFSCPCKSYSEKFDQCTVCALRKKYERPGNIPTFLLSKRMNFLRIYRSVIKFRQVFTVLKDLFQI